MGKITRNGKDLTAPFKYNNKMVNAIKMDFDIVSKKYVDSYYITYSGLLAYVFKNDTKLYTHSFNRFPTTQIIPNGNDVIYFINDTLYKNGVEIPMNPATVDQIQVIAMLGNDIVSIRNHTGLGGTDRSRKEIFLNDTLIATQPGIDIAYHSYTLMTSPGNIFFTEENRV